VHLTYLYNLASYQLRAPWRWSNGVEICRKIVIICQLVVHMLVIVQNIYAYMCHQSS